MKLARARTPRRGRRLAAVVGTLALGATLTAVAPAAQAQNESVNNQFFGMHDASLDSLHTLHVGSLRLWDVGVAWDQVEVKKGVYDWTALDRIVRAAQKTHTQVTMVVAMTPHFYRADPTKPPKDIQDYKNFVKALMQRYKSFHGKRGIASYQVWNEANVPQFWSGTPHQMAELTAAMDKMRNTYDPGATVVAPPMTTRFYYQLGAMQKYLKQKVGGRPVWSYVDVLALNLYPQPKYGSRPGMPEDAMSQLTIARNRLRKSGVPANLPIWNTEVNYGLQTGTKAGTRAQKLAVDKQSAYVVRTLLLNAADGVKRVFWYRYDWPLLKKGGTLGNTLLSKPDHPQTLMKPGKAYLTARQWLKGHLVGKGGAPCQVDETGTYLCLVKNSSGYHRIYWNPTRTVTVTLPANARRKETMYGASYAVVGGSKLRVNYKPVLVDSHKA